MRTQLFGCLFTVLLVSAHGFLLSILNDTLKMIENAVQSKIQTTINIASTLPNFFPYPEMLETKIEEKFIGMPFKKALKELDKLCKIAISGNSTRHNKYTPDVHKIGLVLKKYSISVTNPISRPKQLWDDPLFDKKKKLIVHVTGWLTGFINGKEISSGSVEALYKAYSVRGGYNFVVLDATPFLKTVSSFAAFNTEKIGQLLAKSLVKLVEMYPLENIHLMGHSLGAQIAGATGRHFHKITEQFLPRITGLDPANPCFSEGEALTGIHRGDADFVDIIHTNNGVLGVKDSVGDIDFYPNGFNALQAGCKDIVCAHYRAWKYYAETVYPGNEENFLATRCSSLAALSAGMCKGKRIPMGFACPTNLTGNYYLTTRSSSPFGKNSQYIDKKNMIKNKCWRHSEFNN